MRTIALGLLGATLLGIAVYALVSNFKDKQFAAELQQHRALWETERSSLQQELAAARSRRPIQTVTTQLVASASSPSVDLSAPQIIAKLRTLRANARDPSIRKVIYHLEQLREIGPDAILPIREFLNEFQDVPYHPLREPGNSGERSRGNYRERPRDLRNFNFEVRLTYATPPSLRFGLMDVLQSLGGDEAEATLADVLAHTGRPAELAYAARLLQNMAPGKYGALAISAAQDLLVQPLPIEPGDRLDDNPKDYLYYILTLFNDTSFVATAQTLVISPEGRLDPHALAYLNLTLKENAVPLFYTAYNDSRLTNNLERASLMNLALTYAGKSPQANEMLNLTVANETLSPMVRAMAVVSLARGEPDPETIRARMPLLLALRDSTQDERVLRSVDMTYRNLQNLLEGKPTEENWRSIWRGPESRDDSATSREGRRDLGPRRDR